MITKTLSKVTIAALALAITGTSVVAGPYRCGGTKLVSETTTTGPDFRRSNVPTCDGRFVSGFQVIGSSVDWYTTSDNAGECFNVDVTVLPDGFDMFDNDTVSEYLGVENIDFYRRVFVECKKR